MVHLQIFIRLQQRVCILLKSLPELSYSQKLTIFQPHLVPRWGLGGQRLQVLTNLGGCAVLGNVQIQEGEGDGIIRNAGLDAPNEWCFSQEEICEHLQQCKQNQVWAVAIQRTDPRTLKLLDFCVVIGWVGWGYWTPSPGVG